MDDKKRYGEELPPEIRKMLEDKYNSKKIEINSKDYNGLEDYKKELEYGKVIYEKEMEEKTKKPLEFKIVKEEVDNIETNEVIACYRYIYFYADGTTKEYITGIIPDGLELNKHYSIVDIYGYKVVDDRKGL